MPTPDVDAPVLAAHAALYPTAGTRSVGGGVLVADGLVITCAHVINLVLGTPHGATAPPVPIGDPLPGVQVGFPAHGTRHRVVLRDWVPVAARSDRVEWSGDLAVLEMIDPLPAGVVPAPFGRHRVGSDVWAWYGSAEPTTVARLSVQGTGEWIVLDGTASAQQLVAGYSGGPVWDRELQAVVGLVVSARPDGRGFAIPTSTVDELCRASVKLRYGDTPAAVAQLGAWQIVVTAIEPTLTTAAEREDCARTLITELDLPDRIGSDTVGLDWFAQRALGNERGVPTLLALIAAIEHRRGATDRAREVGECAAHVAPTLLLTAREYRRLAQYLPLLAPTPPADVVRAAVPDRARGGLPDGWADVVAHLEADRRVAGRLPDLLHVMEFAAAALPDQQVRDGLRSWVAGVARRLGVLPGWQAVRRYAEAAASRSTVDVAGLVTLLLGKELPPDAYELYRASFDPPCVAPARLPADDLAGIATDLAQRVARPDGVPPVLVFAAALASTMDDERLADWVGGIDVPSPAVRPARTCSLLVRITDELSAQDRYRCAIWLWDGGYQLLHTDEADTSLDGVRLRIDAVLSDIGSRVDHDHRSRLTDIEFLVPVGLMGVPFDTWEVTVGAPFGPWPLSSRYSVVLRCLDGRRTTQAEWHRKWDWLTEHPDDPRVVEWLPPEVSWEYRKLFARWADDDHPACLAVSPKEPGFGESMTTVLATACYSGLPAAIWLLGDPDPHGIDLLRSLLPADIGGLPAAVGTWRRTMDERRADDGARVALLWDNPHRPPPGDPLVFGGTS
ncbi:MAG TPA: trypsin-like peptidase domain-containing protein [Pseudonocardiaceae bacterium]|nr:trypsin-like peptidase domain-containing protein [Pseudonocardiaceae bacterium]